MEPREVEQSPISDKLARSLIYYARRHPMNEVCGFVLVKDSYIPVKNCASQPWRNFRMSSGIQREVVESHGDDIIGIFHSHPSGNPYPSSNDIIGWPSDEDFNFCRYWIVTDDKVVEWKYTVNAVSSEVKEVWRYVIGPKEGLAESTSSRGSEV